MSRTDDSDAVKRVRSPFRDEELERLLEDFFQRELPETLRPPAPIALTMFEAPSQVRSRSAGRAGVGITAVALVLSVFLVRSGPELSPPVGSPAARSTKAAPDAPVADRARGPRIASPDFEVTENIESLAPLRIDTGDGPVEQRSQRRVTKVSVIDPETGARLEVELPELTIEIIPIKD